MRWLLVAIVVAAAGGAGWVIFHGGVSVEGESDESTERDRPAERETPRTVSLAGMEGAGPRGLRAMVGHCAVKARVTRQGQPAVARVEARFLAPLASLSMGSAWQRWQKDMFTPPPPPGPAVASGTSDAAGNALLSGMAAGVYRLSARTEDGAQAETNVSFPTDGATIQALLELREGGQSLAGKITWTDGTGVGGMLFLTPPFSRGSANWNVPTSVGLVSTSLAADGSFTIGGLGTGSYGVRLLVNDALSVNCPGVLLPSTKPYLLSIEPMTKRIAGRVLDALSGAPIPGATVIAGTSLGNNFWAQIRAVTDGDGRFEVLVARVPAWFSATAPGYGLGNRNVQSAGTDSVVLRLVRTGRIAGRVTTKDGAPAAGALVCSSSGPNNNQIRICDTADKDGNYALEDLYAGEATLAVRGGGWASPNLGDVLQDGFNPCAVTLGGGESLTVDLVVVPSGRIVGKTIDASGAPVAGATVTAANLQSASGAQVAWRLNAALGSASAVSEENGAFTLTDLVPDASYTLQAQSPDFPNAIAGPFPVSAEPTPVEVKFPPARWVDVRVLLEGEESGVPDARITLLAIQGPQNWQGLPGSWTTDREGRVRAGPVGPTPQGDLGVQVAGETVVSNRQPVAIEGSKDAPGPFSVTVRLPRGRTIEGKVLKPDGTPAAGAWVYANPKDSAQGNGASASTATDGTFTLKGLAACTHNVQSNLQAPDGKSTWGASTQAEGGATGVTLTLVENAAAAAREALVVKVFDDRGDPLRQAQVRLFNERGNNNGNAQDGVARFEFAKGANDWISQGLTKGDLYVEAWANRDALDVPLTAGPARVGPLAADQREIEVRLPPGRTIEGRVLADDGAPVRGVLVRARPLPDPNVKGSQAPSFGEGRSDAQGRFVVGALGEGEHNLEISTPPDFLLPEVSPAQAGARGLEIRLRRGVTARIRVRDPDGKLLPRAFASASMQAPPNQTPAQQAEWQRRYTQLQQSGRMGGGQTGEDGVAVLRGLDAACSYVLSVGAWQRDDTRSTNVSPWTPADTEVQLERGYVITGVVRDQQGKPVPGAQVFHKPGTAGWNGVQIQGDGSFKIQGLARGMVGLMAVPPGVGVNWNDPGLPSLTVAAGTEGVTLVVEPSLDLVVRVPNATDRGANQQYVNGQVLVRRNDKWEQKGWANGGEGRLVFKGLRADEAYAVWIAPTPGQDWFGWATNLRAGTTEAVVRLERGGTIRGRITFPAGGTDVGVYAGSDQLWAQATVESDGRYEIRGLPELTWKVQAWCNVQGKHWSAQADAAPGSTVDLKLEER